MGFKRKTDTSGGEQFKFETIGQKLTGFYLGSVEHNGEYGPTKKHLFKTKQGIKVVFGQTHLTSLLEGEVPGSLMLVTYESNKKVRKGNPMKMYTLDIDVDNQLDSSEIVAGVDAATSQEQDEYSDESEDISIDEVSTAPAKSLPRAAAPSAAARAATNDLLNRNRRA